MTTFRSQAPETRIIKDFEIPALVEKESSKGQRHFIHHRPELGVVKMQLWFPTGSYFQPSSFVATAAFDLLFSGGNGRSEKEIIEYLDHLGASVQGDCDVLSSSVNIRCSTNVAKEVFGWVLENMNTCEYPAKEFENYKLVKQAGIERRMQTPGYWSSRLAHESYYGKTHILGKHGTLEDLTELSRETVAAFKQKFIHIGNSMLFISGDCNSLIENDLVAMHDQFFNAKFEHPGCEDFYDIKTNFPATLTHTLSNSSQVSMTFLRHIQSVEEKDVHVLSLLNMVLGGYFGSRLMQEIREERGLTYGIGSHFRPALKGRTWIISGEMNSTNAQIAQTAIVDIMKSLQQEMVSEAELEKAKRYFSGQFRGSFDGPFSLASKMQQKLSRNLSDNYFQDTLKTVWDITPSDILTTAQTYLSPESFVQVMAGNL